MNPNCILIRLSEGHLEFFGRGCAGPQKLQMIICSHSPEILSVAFDRDDCELYHLVAGDELAPIRNRIWKRSVQHLRNLGPRRVRACCTEHYFVEGEDDSEILQEGFKSLFQRYVFRELGGRKNIEKEVKLLQAEESRDRNPLRTAFILDNDNNPTTLRSSKRCVYLQWDRRFL